MKHRDWGELRRESAEGRLLTRYGAVGDGIHDDTGAFRAAAEVRELLAEVERLRGVVEAAKVLLLQSEYKEDRTRYEEWYEVGAPEWETLREVLAALEGKEK